MRESSVCMWDKVEGLFGFMRILEVLHVPFNPQQFRARMPEKAYTRHGGRIISRLRHLPTPLTWNIQNFLYWNTAKQSLHLIPHAYERLPIRPPSQMHEKTRRAHRVFPKHYQSIIYRSKLSSTSLSFRSSVDILDSLPYTDHRKHPQPSCRGSQGSIFHQHHILLLSS